MALPRLVDDQSAGVAAFINSAATEIDGLSSGCIVRRTSSLYIGPNTDNLISWTGIDLDTGGGMWTPDSQPLVTVRVAGVYEINLQVRFGFDNTGSPYNTGTRSARIMVNGVTPSTNAIATDKKPWSVDGEGVTLSCSATARLTVGAVIFGGFRHTASGSITVLHPDFGGTYMAVSRIAPY